MVECECLGVFWLFLPSYREVQVDDVHVGGVDRAVRVAVEEEADLLRPAVLLPVLLDKGVRGVLHHVQAFERLTESICS